MSVEYDEHGNEVYEIQELFNAMKSSEKEIATLRVYLDEAIDIIYNIENDEGLLWSDRALPFLNKMELLGQTK